MTTTPVPAAIAVLLQEHAAGYAQLAALEAAVLAIVPGDAASSGHAVEVAREALFYLETDLEVHIAKEEGPLFPRMKEALPADDRLIDEMVAEHDLIRIKRDDLAGILLDLLAGHGDVREERARLRQVVDQAGDAALTPARLAALGRAATAIIEKMRVHFENEEELVFPLAPRLLDAGTLATIEAEMAAID